MADKTPKSLIFKHLQDKLTDLKVLRIFATNQNKIMGLINKIFGSSSENEIPTINWIELTSLSQLEDISSSKRTSAIFKHSTRCFTSKIVLSHFQKNFDLNANQIDMYFLDLLEYRQISNDIENRYSVMHESPQLLVVKNGNTVADASHSSIINIDLERYIN